MSSASPTSTLTSSTPTSSALSSPTPTGSVLTTDLLVILAPSQTFNGSVIAANSVSTTFLVNFPDSNALGSHNNATVTVGDAKAASGNYQAEISIPNTGSVTISCATSSADPTSCLVMAPIPSGLTGLLGTETTKTTMPTHTYLPVTITAGVDKLSMASTIAPSSTSSTTSSSLGAAVAGAVPPAHFGDGLGLVTLVGMFLGRMFL